VALSTPERRHAQDSYSPLLWQALEEAGGRAPRCFATKPNFASLSYAQ
jgi:hypothetical protein